MGLLKQCYRDVIEKELNKNTSSTTLTYDDVAITKKCLDVLYPYAEKLAASIEPSEMKVKFWLQCQQYLENLPTNIKCKRGNKVQDNSIQMFNKNDGSDFRAPKTSVYKFEKKDFGDFFIHGRADGVDLKKKAVIEIKSKNVILPNMSYDAVSEQEKIQALVYLKLYKCKMCILVYVNNSNGEMTKFEIEFNENKFNHHVIVPLTAFTHYCRKVTLRDLIDLQKRSYDK